MKAQLVAIVKEIAPSLQWCDLEDVVSAALVKAPTCGAQKAVRYALSDWLKEQTETPAPVDDIDLKREMQHARRTVRAASDEDLARWDALLARMPEKEREVAIRLAAGYSHRDIGAELGINHGTVTRTAARIKSRFIDPCLWYPILDALYSLPNTKAERAEYVTDLSEYRKPGYPTRV
jgi:DNA-directed RNA polymerase specialized sigma24 family protein